VIRAAVLFSGGLDSAVLLAQEAQSGIVQPLYVSTGLAWEAAERAVAARLLSEAAFERALPLVDLDFTVRDVYPPTHWAIRGVPPGYDTPDQDVYLVGRNLMLLSKAGIYCAYHGIGRIALGPLAGNPFPDARPAFFEAMARALSLGVDHVIEIAAPLAGMHKE
jgi:7-cyano-7-deazaguanine synthase